MFTGPWRLPADGDLLDVHQSVNEVLIAVVISVLGAWVALIITEQSVYLKRQGSRYWPVWLFMVALSLGGVSIWCTQVMISTGLQTSLPGSNDTLPMSFSFDIAIIALVPSVLLTYAGLLVLMGDVTSAAHRSSSNIGQQSLATASETCIARSSEVELVVKTAEKQAARLSARLHLQHLRRSVTWRVVVGGFLVSAALYESRATVVNIWVQPAVWNYSLYVWMPVWLFDVALTVLSCHWAFHALRTRYLGAFLFAVTVLGDWFIVVDNITFHFLTTGQPLPAALLTANVSYTVMTLVAGVIAAGISFLFVGLQFSRMQLSRNGLSVLVANMQASIGRLKDKLTASEESNRQLKQQLTAICRQVAHTTINTPISTHYAYCMALATTPDFYTSIWHSITSAANRQASSTTIARIKQTPSASSETSPVLLPRASPYTASETGVNNRPPLRLPSITMTPTKSASVAPLPPMPSLRLRSSMGADDTDRTSHEGTAELSRSTAASDPSPSVAPVAAAASASATTQQTTGRKRRSSLSGIGGSNADSASRSRRQPISYRTYEEHLAQLLDQYSPYDSTDTPPAVLSPGGSNKASISMTSNTAGSAGLATLLMHPACIAVIKGELQAIHSVENLIFYLHTQRYKQLQSAKLRKAIATAMYDTFIREGAQQQININARQRDGIGFCVTKRGDDSCSSSLFDDAQREVLQLMETNLLGSKAEKQCAWLMAQMPLTALVGIQPNEEEAD